MSAVEQTNPALEDFNPHQWWLKELERHAGLGETTHDTRRAAGIALAFAEMVFEDRQKRGERQPVAYRWRGVGEWFYGPKAPEGVDAQPLYADD